MLNESVDRDDASKGVDWTVIKKAWYKRFANDAAEVRRWLIEAKLKKGARCACKGEVVDQMWWSAREGVEQVDVDTKVGQYHHGDDREKADDAIEYSTE